MPCTAGINRILYSIVSLDIASARAGHADWLKGVRPSFLSKEQVLDGLRVSLSKARHPILMEGALVPLQAPPSVSSSAFGSCHAPQPLMVLMARSCTFPLIVGVGGACGEHVLLCSQLLIWDNCDHLTVISCNHDLPYLEAFSSLCNALNIIAHLETQNGHPSNALSWNTMWVYLIIQLLPELLCPSVCAMAMKPENLQTQYPCWSRAKSWGVCWMLQKELNNCSGASLSESPTWQLPVTLYPSSIIAPVTLKCVAEHAFGSYLEIYLWCD